MYILVVVVLIYLLFTSFSPALCAWFSWRGHFVLKEQTKKDFRSTLSKARSYAWISSGVLTLFETHDIIIRNSRHYSGACPLGFSSPSFFVGFYKFSQCGVTFLAVEFSNCWYFKIWKCRGQGASENSTMDKDLEILQIHPTTIL